MKQIGRCLIRYADNRVYDLVFANNHETVYSETCINWSCSKEETLLRRSDTFDSVCFLYASLSRISKAETLKNTLLQTDNFSPRPQSHLLYADTKKVLETFKKKMIKLDIFVSFLKEKHFFYTMKQYFFGGLILHFIEGVRYFWVKLTDRMRVSLKTYLHQIKIWFCLFFLNFISHTLTDNPSFCSHTLFHSWVFLHFSLISRKLFLKWTLSKVDTLFFSRRCPL